MSLLVTLWVSCAVSSLRPSSSVSAVTVTVCAAFQVVVVKTRSAVGAKLTSALPPSAFATSTVTAALGSTRSFTVYVALCPSATVSAVGPTTSAGTSSSSTVTVTAVRRVVDVSATLTSVW